MTSQNFNSFSEGFFFSDFRWATKKQGVLLEYPTTIGFQWGYLKNDPCTYTVSGGNEKTNKQQQLKVSSFSYFIELPSVVPKHWVGRM